MICHPIRLSCSVSYARWRVVSKAATERSSDYSRSSKSFSGRSSAGVPSASIQINWRSRWKISTPISPASGRAVPVSKNSRPSGHPTASAARASAARRAALHRRRGLRVLRRRAPCDRRERQRDAGLGSCAASRGPHHPPQIRLPCLRDGSASAGPGAADRRRPANAGAAGAGTGLQILRPHAALPAVADLRPARRRSGALDSRRLDRRRLLVAGRLARAAGQKRVRSNVVVSLPWFSGGERRPGG